MEFRRMWPFDKKKKQQSQLPQEVQEYQQSIRKQRAGVAWLLAFGTLVVTLILAAMLFFAGRFIYQKIADRNDNTNEGPSVTTQIENPSEPESNVGQDDSKPGNKPDANDDRINGTDDSETQSSNEDNTSETPQTGDTVPNTGPGDFLQ